MAKDQIEALERDIRKAQPAIDFGIVLQRLKSSKDFKEVVMKGYFETEAIRLVHLKAEPHMQSPESQASIVAQIDAIGAFSGFLNAALTKAAMATTVVDDATEAMAEINEEQAEEGTK